MQPISQLPLLCLPLLFLRWPPEQLGLNHA